MLMHQNPVKWDEKPFWKTLCSFGQPLHNINGKCLEYSQEPHKLASQTLHTSVRSKKVFLWIYTKKKIAETSCENFVF